MSVLSKAEDKNISIDMGSFWQKRKYGYDPKRAEQSADLNRVCESVCKILQTASQSSPYSTTPEPKQITVFVDYCSALWDSDKSVDLNEYLILPLSKLLLHLSFGTNFVPSLLAPACGNVFAKGMAREGEVEIRAVADYYFVQDKLKIRFDTFVE